MKKISSVEHIWCDSNDRWVYKENYEDGEVGLNFMQGDEYEEFKRDWCKVDKGLSEFYEQMRITMPIQYQSESNLGFINTVMWSYHSAIAYYEQYSNPTNRKYCECK
jgi:hypothetical protein